MKQYYCFLEKFNNYFNRKIIKFETLSEYENNSESFFIPVDSEGGMIPFDFNPNDNVMTEIIVNDVPFDPDYFLLLDADSNIIQRWFVLEQKRNRQGQWVYQLRRDVIADNLDNLETAPIFVEKGMLAEDDPFIVNDEGMSLNQIKKSMTQLKDRSNSAWVVGYLAKDAVASDKSISVITQTKKKYSTLSDIASAIGTTETILAELINSDVPSKFSNSIKINYAVGVGTFGYLVTSTLFSNNSLGITIRSATDNMTDRLYTMKDTTLRPAIESLITRYAQAMYNRKTALFSQLPTILNRSYFLTNYQLERLRAFEGETILYLGAYYTIHVSVSGNGTSASASNFSYSLYSSIENISEDASDAEFTLSAGSKIESVITEDVLATVQLLPSEDGETYETQLSTSRNVCQDQQFDMFCIPAGEIEVFDDSSHTVKTINVAQILAEAIALQEDAKIYDIQLLPYCPVIDDAFVFDAGQPVDFADLTNLDEHEDFEIIYGPDNPNSSHSFPYTVFRMPPNMYLVRDGLDPTLVNVTLIGNYASRKVGPYDTVDEGSFTDSYTVRGTDSSNITNMSVTYSYDSATKTMTITSMSFNCPVDVDLDHLYIDLNINFEYTKTPISFLFYPKSASFAGAIPVNLKATESLKVESNCNLYRITSPNYQGVFDFNLAKNGGTCEYLNYYCTYKPYTPFIKVCPAFNFLYGTDYNDNRGLICGGDFSLPRIAGAWESYQLQNKNYQNIFNRDIQNLDFMQSIERRNQIVSGAVGIVTDTAKGAGAGAFVGGPVGALVGGAVGGITSGVGYAIDVDTLARTQRETKQLAIDKFNYQLGNIKAIPYTLTKVGSFDIASKIFPCLEYYTCSDKELEAFKSKIKYESMTVMRIGTLNEYMGFNGELNYFKGSLIRNDEIADDTHILNAIYEELLKGVYI